MKQKVLLLVKRLIKSELISGSAYLFIGTMASNILAFIFNLLLVRNVSYAEYAEITSIVSLITLASIPTLAFIPTIVQFAGRYFAKDQYAEAGKFFRQSNRVIGVIALLFFLLFFIASQFIANFLHITSVAEIMLSGLVVVVMYLGITNTAFLQSLLKFQFLAFTLMLGSVIKLVAGIGLLFVGFGVFGVLWGYFLSFLVPLALTFLPLKKFLIGKTKKTLQNVHPQEIIAYGLPATVAIFSLSSFTSSDILLVKHFFPSSTAALYSGLSLIGKIIFYFSAPIATVMFPLVTKRFHKGEALHNLLYASFLLVLIPSLGLSVFYFLFPHFMIALILGNRYLAIVPLLGWFGIYLSIFSLVSLLVNFLLSVKQTSVAVFIAVGALLQIVGISLFHSSLGIIVAISLILSLVLFVILLLYYQSTYANTKKVH